MKVAFTKLIIILTALAVSCWNSSAQPVKPVFTSTSLDGQLMGFETGDLTLGPWKPNIAFAVPTDFSFRVIRFRAGAGWSGGYEIPVVKQQLGNPSLTYVNWFSTPILGREGQTGGELGFNVGDTRYSGFVGDLWPVDASDVYTPVAFFATNSFNTLELPYGWRLSITSDSVMGLVLPSGSGGLPDSIKNLVDALSAGIIEHPFRSGSYSLSLSLGGLRLSGRFGMLSNEAHLKNFEFVTGVRGISRSLTGDKFWNFTVERAFTMYQTSIPLHLPEQLAGVPLVPQELAVRLEGKVFFQGGAATHELSTVEAGSGSGDPGKLSLDKPSEMPVETDMLFSWGMSTTLTVHEVSLRAELIFTQSGETKFTFSF